MENPDLSQAEAVADLISSDNEAAKQPSNCDAAKCRGGFLIAKLERQNFKLKPLIASWELILPKEDVRICRQNSSFTKLVECELELVYKQTIYLGWVGVMFWNSVEAAH
jgi:tRNA U34 5-carboxymethylaminomethyl modifying GTPase MnmE/TrmE